jgi:hypothetical protein
LIGDGGFGTGSVVVTCFVDNLGVDDDLCSSCSTNKSFLGTAEAVEFVTTFPTTFNMLLLFVCCLNVGAPIRSLCRCAIPRATNSDRLAVVVDPRELEYNDAGGSYMIWMFDAHTDTVHTLESIDFVE